MLTPPLSRIHRALLGAFVIVLSATGCGGAAAGAGQPPPSSSAVPLSPPVAVSPDYRSAVEYKVSDRLHTTPERVRSQLQSDPNATLMTLAKPAGLDLDQLGAIVRSALDDSADAALNSGSWSAQQADEEKRYWAAQGDGDLIAEVSRWFRQG